LDYVYGVVLDDGGSGYTVGDVMSISGTALGGINTINNALLTVIATESYDTIEIAESSGDSTIGQYEVNDFVTSVATNEDWDFATSYNAGTIVVIGGQPMYYQATQNVPAGLVDYTDTAYWSPYTFIPTVGIVTAVSSLGDTVTILRHNNIPFSHILRKTTTAIIDGQVVTIIDDATCVSVDTIGGIISGVSVTGTASLSAKGNSYTDLTSTNVVGSGNGAIFTIIAPQSTVFDGSSVRFIAPVDMYSNTQEYDRYLVFPYKSIVNPEELSGVVGWTNNSGAQVAWDNNSDNPVTWINSIT
jgi:hypothetical protein